MNSALSMPSPEGLRVGMKCFQSAEGLCETSVPQTSRGRGLGGLGCAAGSQSQAGFAANEEAEGLQFGTPRWNPHHQTHGRVAQGQQERFRFGLACVVPALCFLCFLSQWHLAAFQQVPSVVTTSMSYAVYLCTLIRVQRPDIKHQSIGPNLLWVLSPQVSLVQVLLIN